MLDRLPPRIKEKAEALFKVFRTDPFHPILGNEDLYDSKRGSHRVGSRSVEVTKFYRAIYVVDRGPDGKGPEQCCWYWIGSREAYAGFIGCR